MRGRPEPARSFAPSTPFGYLFGMGIIDALLGLRTQNVELGLAAVTRLLDRLDHPERDFPAIHVAGTNGKGSTSAMIAAQLQGAGRRVGLLTSPHLVHFSERIRVNGAAIHEDEAAPILEAMRAPDGAAGAAGGASGASGGAAGGGAADSFDASFFEVATALAFEHFRRRGVDVAVLEVGLGGRLDATNVCFPAVTAITTIDFDHTAALGTDLASIAAEKAGIVKPGVPVVVGAMPDEPRAVIEAIAARRGADVVAAADGVEMRLIASTWEGIEAAVRFAHAPSTVARVPLPGRHQLENLRVALLAARMFEPDPSMLEAMLEGLAATRWPGRLEKFEGGGRGGGPNGPPPRVYDVAHNAGGAAALAAALDELGVPAGSMLVLGVLEDKDLQSMAAHLARHFPRAVATTPPHPVRSRPAAQSAAVLRAAGIEATPVDDVAAAVREAASRLEGDGWLFVTGSLFTVGAAMAALGDGPAA